MLHQNADTSSSSTMLEALSRELATLFQPDEIEENYVLRVSKFQDMGLKEDLEQGIYAFGF